MFKLEALSWKLKISTSKFSMNFSIFNLNRISICFPRSNQTTLINDSSNKSHENQNRFFYFFSQHLIHTLTARNSDLEAFSNEQIKLFIPWLFYRFPLFSSTKWLIFMWFRAFLMSVMKVYLRFFDWKLYFCRCFLWWGRSAFNDAYDETRTKL